VRLANLRLQLLQVQRRRDFLVAAILLKDQTQHQQQRRRTMWVKPWLLRRVTLGHYDTLMQELMRESRGNFKSFLRMEPEMFDRVAPRIEKSQEGRLPLSPGLKLAITLRFLSTRNSYQSLAFCYRTVIVRRPYNWCHTVRRPCAALTAAARSPYGRHAACSQAPYDIIQEFLTVAGGAARRLEICDRAGYGRRGIVRCLTKTKIARFRWWWNYLTAPVAFVTEVLCFTKQPGYPVHRLTWLPVTLFYLWIRFHCPSLAITLWCRLRNVTSLWQQWRN